MSAHVLGFTNIDDQGQEGLELAYNDWLKGIPGQKRVLKDRFGHVMADLTRLQDPHPGNDLALSIDRRIQYIAYRELEKTVTEFKAASGTVVVMDPKTGEILAMVNHPSYNPNYRLATPVAAMRNRAATDVFEPGSVIKAFSVANALQGNLYHPESIIDTRPGWISVGGHLVRDIHSYGVLTVTGVLQRSSNVGVSKMTLAFPPQQLWESLHRVGFGELTESGFPGESPGVLPTNRSWRPFAIATMAFGYGLSVTALQLAHAYTVFANEGQLVPVSLLRVSGHPHTQSVMDPKIAREMLTMLEAVVEKGGTGTTAKVSGYRVAGKTGTARIAGQSGYESKHHISSFVGIAPVMDPRLLIVVVIHDPQGQYYGNIVAAPVFARIMQASLQLLNVPMDGLNQEEVPQNG